MKKIFSILSALSVLLIFGVGTASASGGIAMNAGYYKGGGAYDVVVKEIPGNQLKIYVNDKDAVATTTNSKGWATFRRVKLSGNGKVSFTTVYTSGKQPYEKPINYTRLFNVANNQVSFSNPAQSATPTVQPAAAQTPPSAPTNTGTNDSNLSNNNTYVNSDGDTVHSPAMSTDGSVPAGATAHCRDGSYSFSQHRSGTCSGHGGVASWL